MDSIRASEAPDAGSIPAEATSLKNSKKTKALPNKVVARLLSAPDAFIFY